MMLKRLLFTLFLFPCALCAGEKTAQQIIREAIDHYRDQSSYSVAQMTIHRPDWERTMEMKVWTQGLDKSLVRITEPRKDRGNGTLLIEDNMWSFSPKINRVIKIPGSMANQSWMGSDFSNNDIARADELIEKYTHTLLSTETHEGQTVYVIQSVPHEDAPVVWGKEIVKVREDNVMLDHAFYDQDGKLVKVLDTREIKKMSGKTIATIERMTRTDAKDEWTEFRIKEVDFGITMPDNTFTLSNLRNPRF